MTAAGRAQLSRIAGIRLDKCGRAMYNIMSLSRTVSFDRRADIHFDNVAALPFRNAAVNKIKETLHTMKKRAILASVLSIFTIVASIYGAFSIIMNSYTKPIREAEKIANAAPEDYDREAAMSKSFGGLGESDLETIFSVVNASAVLSPTLDEAQTTFASKIETRRQQYGDDAIVGYAVESKEELSISELQKAKTSITEQGERLIGLGEFFETLTEQQIADLTEAMDITPDDFEKLTNAVQSLGKEIAEAQVSVGYRVLLVRTITDENDNEIDTQKLQATVLNINGQWLAYDYENGGGFMVDDDFGISPQELELILEPLRNV